MSRYIKLGVFALVILAASLVSAFTGGSIGFLQGYSYGRGDTGATSYILTTSLRAFRTGDVETGISLLEGELDESIVLHWATRQDNPPILPWVVYYMGMEKSDPSFFGTVARYRAKYPSTNPDPNVRGVIASHLKTFESTDTR